MDSLPARIRVVVAAGAVLAAPILFAGLALAQQCSPAAGGSPCGFADGVASRADPDGGDLTVGNPIHPITGNKYQEELDAPPLPGFLGLEIRRHYNSSYVAADTPWGRGWALSYDTRVYRSGSSLQIVQADGRRLVFSAPADSAGGTSDPPCVPAAPGQGDLYIESDGYRWVWPQQRELVFDRRGDLVQIGPVGGLVSEVARIVRDPGGRITHVTDPAGRSMEFSYDANGYLSRISHPLGEWRYRVDPGGQVDSVLAPDGVMRRYRYDDIGHRSRFTAIAISAPGKAEQVIGRWTYDLHGRAVGYRRPDGSELRMQFDQQPDGKRVSTLTNALGGRTVYSAAEIAGRWRVMEIRGPGCAECGPADIRMRYDPQGQLIAKWRIGGDGIEYRRDRYGRVVQVTAVRQPDRDSGGRDSDGREPGVVVLRLEYPDQHAHWPSLVARPSVATGMEAKVLFERDERGNLLALTQTGYAPAILPDRGARPPLPISRTVQMRYETVSGRRVLVSVDGPLPNGPAGDPTDSDVTQFHYDEHDGQLRSFMSPGGAVRRFSSQDPAGRPTVTIDTDGFRELERQNVYDIRGNRVSSRVTGWLLDRGLQRIPGSAVHGLSHREYNLQGRVIRSVDPAGREIHWDHDAAGRASGVRDSRGYRSALTRDAEGQVKIFALHEPESKQPLRATYFDRDPDGRLLSMLLPDGRQIRYHYDTNGQAIGFTDPDRLLQFALPEANLHRDGSDVLDDFGRVLLRMLPEHGHQSLTYDEAGRIVEIVDAGGGKTVYGYDAAGRLLSSGRADGTATVAYAYEGNQLVSVDDPAQSTRYSRDAFGRVVQTRVLLSGMDGGPKVLSTVRDPDTGLVTDLGLADGQSVHLVRNSAQAAGDVRQLKLRSAFWTSMMARLRPWLPSETAHRIEGLVPGAIVAEDIEVHPFNGLARLRHGNGMLLTRRFDLAGRTSRLRSAGVHGVAIDWRYGYGAGPRMRTIEAQGQSSQGGALYPRLQRFDYDALGVLRTATEPAGPGAQPGITLTSADGHRDQPTVKRDALGRVILDGHFRYAYTASGQVREVRDARNGGLVAIYDYNHLGQRVRKTVNDEAGRAATVFFLWHDGRLVAEMAPDGTVSTQYLGLNDGRRFLPIAKLERVTRSTGERRMQLKQATGPGNAYATLAIHADHRGAPVAMTDARQRLVWRAAVAPSGLAHVDSARGGSDLNLRLPGQYWDKETGLHDNWHRTYDPRSGRYLQPDPLGRPGGPDAYRYAGGDPINRIDPLGLYEIDVHYYMTFFLGVTAGLDPEEARIVALASQYVDNNPLTRPVDRTSLGTTIGSILHNQQALLAYHFVLSGADGRTLPDYRSVRLTNPDSPQLRNLLAAAGSGLVNRNGSLQFLGEYLHALADTYSHRDARGRPYDALFVNCGVGHGHDLHEPDLTYDDIVTAPETGDEGQPPAGQVWRREARTLEMERTLYRTLLGYGNPAKAKTPEEIDAVLRAFNAIREREESGTVEDFYGEAGHTAAGAPAIGVWKY